MHLPLRFFLFNLLFVSILFSQPTDTTSIRFAWLTDIHVGSTTGKKDLRTVVQDIKQENAVSFAIVSGDISEIDMGDNLQIAKSLLDSMDIPYYIIPGNHDTKWTDSGGGRFSQLWGNDRFMFEWGEYLFIGVHQGPLMRMGNGYIDPDDIAWVNEMLQALTDPQQKVFIVLHYPLDPSIDNWHALRDVIRPFNIQAILHGHGHSNRVQSYEGIPGIMSRSTLGRRQAGSGYSLVQLYPKVAEFSERIPSLDSLRMWYSLPLGNNRPADTLLLPYPDYSENDTSGVALTWQVATGSIITSAPAVQNNQVIVSTTAGKVLALDLETGIQNWNWSAHDAIHSTPAIKGSRVVFGSIDSTITCLSTRDGQLKWQIKTNGPVLGSPLIHKSNVFIGSGNGVFRSLKLRNGKLNWSNSTIDGYIETKPVISGGLVMFGAWDGGFYALDLKHGTLRWKWSEGRQGPLYSPAACWPVTADSKVFIVAPDRAMTAINISDGKTVWRKTGHKVRETIGISEDKKTIFARTMQDSVFAIRSEASDFEIKWNVHAGFGYDFAPSAIIEEDDQIFFGTRDGRVYCLDSLTGAVIWHYRVSDGLVNTIATVTGNSILVTAADGNVSFLSF